jgi:polyisoprenoid-binding protein YceI
MPWVLDKAHSSVEFGIGHLHVSMVRGRFTDFDAEVSVDLDSPRLSFVNASIRSASVDTGNPERDKQLRSSDVLDVEHFPTIEFRSTDAVRLGERTFWLRGNLTIHGTAQEVRLEGRVQDEAVEADGTRTATLTVRADIDRDRFFKIPMRAGDLLIGRSVTVVVNARVREVPATHAAAPTAESVNREEPERG